MNKTTQLSERDEINLNLENIRNEIGHLMLHKEVLMKLIDNCKKIFESKIVIPKITRNLSTAGKGDLSIDIVPVDNLNPEQLRARYEFFQYSSEMANIIADIEVKIELYHAYQEHLKQYYQKQTMKITDELIMEKLRKAQDLKPEMSDNELATLKGIIEERPKRLNGGKDTRIELYEALQNLILQHG